jgi:hypothetical protein
LNFSQLQTVEKEMSDMEAASIRDNPVLSIIEQMSLEFIGGAD